MPATVQFLIGPSLPLSFGQIDLGCLLSWTSTTKSRETFSCLRFSRTGLSGDSAKSMARYILCRSTKKVFWQRTEYSIRIQKPDHRLLQLVRSNENKIV
jgi:hypothetical protein